MNLPARRLLTLVAACGLACSLAAPARADGPAGSDRPEDALRGPAVRDREVPGVTGSFGEAGAEKRRMMAERIPPRVFREAMQPLLDDDAPDELRLDADKKARFKSMIEGFEGEVRDYMKAHRDEIQRLREEAGDPAAKGGGRGAGPLGGNATPKMREKFRTLMEGAPKIEDVYTKVWAELTPAQRTAVDARLDQWRDQRAKERQDNYVRQKSGKKAAGAAKAEADAAARDARPAPGRTPPPPRRGPNGQTLGGNRGPDAPPGAPGAGITPEKRERLLDLFARMSPEQQDQLLRRLEQAREGPREGPLEGMRDGRPGDGQGPGPGQPRRRRPGRPADAPPPPPRDAQGEPGEPMMPPPADAPPPPPGE